MRNTFQGVKWRLGGEIVAVPPGSRTWYWPIITDFEQRVCARQPVKLPPQVLMTRDKKPVTVRGLVVYSISDIIRAIGERNWDVDSTVCDISMAIIVENIMCHTLDELLDGVSEGINGEFSKQLTNMCQDKLDEYGVAVENLVITDFSTCKVYKIMGIGQDGDD